MKNAIIIEFPRLRINYWAVPKVGNTTIRYCLLRLEERENLTQMEKHYGTTDSALPWLYTWTKKMQINPDRAFTNGHYNFAVTRPPEERYQSAWRDFKYKRPNHGMGGSREFQQAWRTTHDYQTWRTVLDSFKNFQRDVHWKTTDCFIHPGINIMTIDQVPVRVGIALNVKWNSTNEI